MRLKRLILPGILLLLGIGATILGALFKIQHWPYGAEILTFGSFLELLAILWAIIILIKIYQNK